MDTPHVSPTFRPATPADRDTLLRFATAEPVAWIGPERLRADGAERVVGTTDAANAPMRSAFERAHFQVTRTRIVHAA